MITAEELVIEIDNSEESKNFKLATVVELFTNKTAKIKFDGEDVPSEKQYAYLDSYVPGVNDRVLLGVLGGTYVILGKVNYNVSPSIEEEIDRYVFDLKTVSILKGLQVTGAVTFNNGVVTFNNGMTVVGDIGVNGNVMATGVSATGAMSAGSFSTPGTLGAGATTLSSLNVTGSTTANTLVVNSTARVKSILTVDNHIYADSGFMHRGSYLSFFNKGSLVAKRNVYQHSGTPTLESLRDKLNAVISALQDYGLIN